MNEIQIMCLNEREKQYFDYLDNLSTKEFNSKISNEVNNVFNSVKNAKTKVCVKNGVGIFRKTHGRVKCASGVRFGTF